MEQRALPLRTQGSMRAAAGGSTTAAAGIGGRPLISMTSAMVEVPSSFMHPTLCASVIGPLPFPGSLHNGRLERVWRTPPGRQPGTAWV